MADTTKTIKNASNSELNAIIYRLRSERDCLQILRDIQATSTPNPNNPYPDWEKLGPFSTETIVYEGKSIKQMTDQELSEYLGRLRNESELINIIQNIKRFNKPTDNQVAPDSTPYPGLDLNSPIDNLYHAEIDKMLEHFGIPGMRWGQRKTEGGPSRSDIRSQKKLAKADKKFASDAHKLVPKLTQKLYLENRKFQKEAGDTYENLTVKYKNKKSDTEIDNMYQHKMMEVYDKYLKNDPATYSPSKTARASWGTVTNQYGQTYLTPVLLVAKPIVEHADKEFDIGFAGTFQVLKTGELIVIEPAIEQEDESLNHIDEQIDNTLAHFGIPGMHWGVRRAASKTGSSDYQQSRALKKKGLKNLSTAELKALNERQQQERNYKNLNPDAVQRGKQAGKAVLAGMAAVTTIYTFANSPAGKSMIGTAKKVVSKTIRG